MDPQRYMRPPPPPPGAADQPPRQLPPPPPGHWYPPPPQFQYQPPPPPPPHQQQHWAPPPPPYPVHSQYTPPHPHPHLPSPYHPPPPPQDWGNMNWGHHGGWEYPVSAARQDEEDWAAKARAWAASKAASENQHPQSQFTSVSRLEGQSPYHDPYQQTVGSHYADVQSTNPSPGYHQYQAPGASSQKPSLIHPQEYTAINSGPSSFVPDGHVAYGAKDGSFGGDSNAAYPHQESSSASSLVHMQEVPSSYSSITGKIEAGDGREKLYASFPLPADSSQVPFHDHLPPPPVGRSVLMEQPHYTVGNHAAELPIDLSEQPLNFTRKYSFDQEPVMQQTYNNNDPGGPVRIVDPVGAAPSNHSWTSPHLPGTVYPPFPPGLPSAQQQHEPSVSSIPGHSTPPFGRLSGPSFQSSIPSIGIGATSGLHPTTVFPGDVYGVLSGSDRPKKAPVPDWLKEEIIKNKAIIASSGPERPTDSIEDEAFDKTPGRADQEDSKSIDSPRSAVEDDEEDNMEAIRTAEVNQEIKRILTEVLLKVTDELFDEIATQVLREDLTIQDAQHTVAPDRNPSFAVPAALTPKASAKVLVSAKAKKVETEDESGKFTSSSPGDLLGLASYASDDDDADDTVQHQPSTKKFSEGDYTAENGNAQAEFERDSKSQVHGKNIISQLVNGVTVPHDPIDIPNFEGRKMVETPDTSKLNSSVGEKVIKTESIEDVGKKLSAKDDSQGRETRNRQNNKDGDAGETRKSYVGRDIVKAGDGGKHRKGGKEDESHRRHDERYVKSEMATEKNNGSKEKTKEQGGKLVEKAKDSRTRSSDPDGKMDSKGKERDRRADGKDDSDRRRERKKDEKGERYREKSRSESSRHRSRRSPSDGSRGRSSKGNSRAGHANYPSDESSDESIRKLHAKKRNLSRSPSPCRSRKRQDSRSPPSKHSRRRHSPLSSLENSRGRRSRSRSPARRQR